MKNTNQVMRTRTTPQQQPRIVVHYRPSQSKLADIARATLSGMPDPWAVVKTDPQPEPTPAPVPSESAPAEKPRIVVQLAPAEPVVRPTVQQLGKRRSVTDAEGNSISLAEVAQATLAKMSVGRHA